jgi:lipoyl(octanoyl) transferase
VSFAETSALQERLRAEVLAGAGPETLLFCEHDPVITLGRSAEAAHVLASASELARRGVTVARATRGGDVTYHGPGQLVGYPVVRLRGGVVDHMTAMARAIASVLAGLGLVAIWRREAPGLWITRDGADEKICAFGIHIRARVAIHGFALNVGTNLDAFDLIVPCGLTGARTTSIARMGITPPSLEDLAARVARAFGDEIGVTFHSKIDERALDAIAMSGGITKMIGE